MKLVSLALACLMLTGCWDKHLQTSLQPAFCSSYTVVSTLHCDKECSKDQELAVDKNNAVHMEHCK